MRAFRILVILAGIMGADGVILAAVATHQGDAARLMPASSMLLFHATAVLAVVALTERGIVAGKGGLAAAFGFVIASALFAGDLCLRHFADHAPVSVCGADRRHAPDRQLAGAGHCRCMAPAELNGRRRIRFAPCPTIG